MDESVIASLLILGALSVIAIAYYLGRVRPVNRARAARGLAPLRWRDIHGSDLDRDTLAGENARIVLGQEKELRRQMDWEAEQAQHEFIKLGSHITRTHCRAHDRWCYHAHEEGHPPGGFDNPRVPDEWPPDLRDAVKGKRQKD